MGAQRRQGKPIPANIRKGGLNNLRKKAGRSELRAKRVKELASKKANWRLGKTHRPNRHPTKKQTDAHIKKDKAKKVEKKERKELKVEKKERKALKKKAKRIVKKDD